MRSVTCLVLMLVGVASADVPVATRTAPPPLPAGVVDLLAYEGSEVAVSSTVANAKLPPRALVDGDLETAWNSRTNELAGAWIGFHAPSGAHVVGIRLTVGFTHVDGADDWFTMNPRVAKIRVSQGGRVIVEAVLDIKNRGMQTVDFDAVQTAGDFRIDLVDVALGSKPAWREASISELQVLGMVWYAKKRTAPMDVQVGGLASRYGKPPPPVAPYKPAPRPLLVLRAPAAGAPTLVLLDAWRSGVVTTGTRIAIAPGIPSMQPSSRGPVVLQPIVEPLALDHPWVGRALRLYGASGKVCDGTIDTLALVVDGKAPPRMAPPDDRDVAAAWADQRDENRMLVAVIRSKTSCAGALWARDRAAPAPSYGRIEPKRLRDPMHARYFDATDDGYAQLGEHYRLEDLDGEYENAAVNEAKIPPEDRLSPALVDKTWTSFAACDRNGRCVGAAAGAYGIHTAARGYVIEGGTVIDASRLSTDHASSPLAAADLDGDGSIDLVYATETGIGVFGRGLAASAELYSPN